MAGREGAGREGGRQAGRRDVPRGRATKRNFGALVKKYFLAPGRSDPNSSYM